MQDRIFMISTQQCADHTLDSLLSVAAAIVAVITVIVLLIQILCLLLLFLLALLICTVLRRILLLLLVLIGHTCLLLRTCAVWIYTNFTVCGTAKWIASPDSGGKCMFDFSCRRS